MSQGTVERLLEIDHDKLNLGLATYAVVGGLTDQADIPDIGP